MHKFSEKSILHPNKEPKFTKTATKRLENVLKFVVFWKKTKNDYELIMKKCGYNDKLNFERTEEKT